MHIDFSSAIDNARLIAARHAALRPHSDAVQFKSSRWGALPCGGRAETPGRVPDQAMTLKPAAVGKSAHAH